MNHTNVVDVKAWIDTRPVSRFQWNVLLLCFIIIMLDGYDAAVMGFVAPALIEDWGISRAEMGPILGAAMFGVAIGATVAGRFLTATAESEFYSGRWRCLRCSARRRRGAKPDAAGADAFSHRPWPWRRNAQLRHAGGGIYAGAA